MWAAQPKPNYNANPNPSANPHFTPIFFDPDPPEARTDESMKERKWKSEKLKAPKMEKKKSHAVRSPQNSLAIHLYMKDGERAEI